MMKWLVNITRVSHIRDDINIGIFFDCFEFVKNSHQIKLYINIGKFTGRVKWERKN